MKFLLLIFISCLFISCSKDCEKKVPDGLCICPKQVDPVCGCDAVTYSNSCLAECAGITNYAKGKCD